MDVWEGYRAEFMDLIIYVNFDSFFIIIFFIVATTFFLLREADSLFYKIIFASQRHHRRPLDLHSKKKNERGNEKEQKARVRWVE